MSDLPASSEFDLVTSIWAIAGVLVSVSVLVCLYLSIRRLRRNYLDRIRERDNHTYDHLIGEVLNKPDDEDAKAQLSRFRGVPSALSRSVLNYFRTVRGRRADDLRSLISSTRLEKQIIKATRKGTRGHRMRAVQVLSYLESDNSLTCIRRHLRSNNRYERLTAARALARRKSLSDCGDVVASISSAFPDKQYILAETLLQFGPEVQTALEHIAARSQRKNVVAACLEALVMLAPASTSLDLEQLMADPDARVRAAAISFSVYSEDVNKSDLLLRGLADDAIKVKIRSAKIASDISRSDAAPLLYKLTRDDAFWVRYWALRGLWRLGKTGRQMVEAIARSNEIGSQMAVDVAREMAASHV